MRRDENWIQRRNKAVLDLMLIRLLIKARPAASKNSCWYLERTGSLPPLRICPERGGRAAAIDRAALAGRRTRRVGPGAPDVPTVPKE